MSEGKFLQLKDLRGKHVFVRLIAYRDNEGQYHALGSGTLQDISQGMVFLTEFSILNAHLPVPLVDVFDPIDFSSVEEVSADAYPQMTLQWVGIPMDRVLFICDGEGKR